MSIYYSGSRTRTLNAGAKSCYSGGSATGTIYHAGDYIPSAPTLTIYSSVSLNGAEIRIYDMDNIPAGSLGTELVGTESSSTTDGKYPIVGIFPGNTIWIQIMLEGYEEYGLPIVFPARDTQFYATLKAELNA